MFLLQRNIILTTTGTTGGVLHLKLMCELSLLWQSQSSLLYRWRAGTFIYLHLPKITSRFFTSESQHFSTVWIICNQISCLALLMLWSQASGLWRHVPVTETASFQWWLYYSCFIVPNFEVIVWIRFDGEVFVHCEVINMATPQVWLP